MGSTLNLIPHTKIPFALRIVMYEEACEGTIGVGYGLDPFFSATQMVIDHIYIHETYTNCFTYARIHTPT